MYHVTRWRFEPANSGAPVTAANSNAAGNGLVGYDMLNDFAKGQPKSRRQICHLPCSWYCSSVGFLEGYTQYNLHKVAELNIFTRVLFDNRLKDVYV